MKGANNSSKDRNSSNKPPTSGNNPSSKKQRGKRKKGPKKLDETAQGIPKNSTDTKESSVKNSNDSNNNATLPNGNTATRSNSNEIGVSNSCNAHPNKSLLSPTETLSLLHSKTFFKNFSEEASASSMLCNDCSVKVACCFNVMQDTLQNFMAEMLGLRKTAKCVECVQQHLQQTLTNGRQHVEHVPVVCKVEQDEQNETPKTEQTTAIKQEVTECPFVNKDVKSEDEKDEAFRPSNIGGNAISPADHNRCDPAQCHIRRWYCSTPPASVSPIKKPITKPIKSEKDSPNPLVNSPQMQITSPLESLTSVHNIENEISQTSVNNVKQEMSSASTGSPTTDKVKSEAYVTLATNDLHAIGCLILGHSIRLTGTARSLAVVVSNRDASGHSKLSNNLGQRLLSCNVTAGTKEIS
ncbi:hypothetical protein GQR58_008812 [Nymphon striatum]|nr:hypothetical protein GQR58_008812 [Nymphon striatum]